MIYNLRRAKLDEVSQIWEILKGAIQRRKEEGSNQWQDGYPNTEVITSDIDKNIGFVLTEDDIVIGYVAILINDEPEYENIEGEWLSKSDFVVFHRVAISQNHLGKGLAKKMFHFIEEYALNNDIYSVKADTNHDNGAMLSIFEKTGYKFCGLVYFRGSPRRAYEKVLST